MTERLAYPLVLIALAILPILVFFWMRARHTSAVVLSDASRLTSIKPTLRVRLRWLPRALRLAVLTLLIIAIARPQEVSGRVETTMEGVAMQVVIDRSPSMQEPILYEGQRAQRLAVVREIVKEFLTGKGNAMSGREGDLIGLIAFSGYADTIAPLTRSTDALVEMVDTIELAQLRSEGGTAIGEALALAAARLKSAEEALEEEADDAPADSQDFTIKSKAIILVTDGENNAGAIDPIAAANLARDWDIKVYTIGIGRGTRRFAFGGFDATLLEQIASITSGKYFHANDSSTLRNIYAEISELETTSIDTVEYTNVTERYTPWAQSALALLAIEFFLGTLVFRRLT
ncbi:MAG: vWA domain-containing protein [Planctomycetota bacterium]|jgi:Ca-activated chloride channel family protein